MSIRIELEVADNLPDGVVRAHDGFWKGQALVCSRSKIDIALQGDTLDVSGVYILSGVQHSKESSTPEEVIYIGSGDSVRDRIQSHSKKKLFWRTAVVFHRPGEELHYGNIRYIEARLVALAKATNLVLLDNDATPRVPAMPESAKQESEQFVERIVLYLRALGLDFFTPPPATNVTEPPPDDPMMTVPQPLRPLVAQVRSVLETLPMTTFYATKSPDVRSKVTVGNTFRVFARLKFRSNGIRLQLKDVDDNIWLQVGDADVAKHQSAIETAHKLAMDKLERAS